MRPARPDNRFHTTPGAHYARAIGRRSGDAMAIVNPNQTLAQARSLIGAGRFRQALAVLEALQKKPGGRKNPTLLASLAECHMGLSNVEQALDAIDRAIKADPKNPMHRTNKGQALLQTMQLDRAETAFISALECDSKWPPAILGLTGTLRLLNREDEAFARLEPLLADENIQPMIDLAFALLCAKLGRQEEGIARLQRWVDHERVPPMYRMQGLFQLGVLTDMLGRHDEAFGAYHRANAMRPGAFDPVKRRAMTDRVIACSTRSALHAIPEPGKRSDKPIFIVGMPRSGTSLIEQVVSCHPRIFGAGELTAINSLVQSLQQRDQSTLTPQELQQTIDRLAGGYLGLLNKLSGGAEFVTDKNPLNFMHLGIISRVFPGARIIHCLRNPIDTCVSCYFHNFMGATSFTDDLAGLGSYYNEYRRLMEHWSSVIETPILDVVYEEVVGDLETNARRILEYLGVEWDPEVLRFNESGRVTMTASMEQVRRPIYKSSVERWRRYEKHLGPLLGALEPRFRPGSG